MFYNAIELNVQCVNMGSLPELCVNNIRLIVIIHPPEHLKGQGIDSEDLHAEYCLQE